VKIGDQDLSPRRLHKLKRFKAILGAKHAVPQVFNHALQVRALHHIVFCDDDI
jgi:hypothetical protein